MGRKPSASPTDNAWDERFSDTCLNLGFHCGGDHFKVHLMFESPLREESIILAGTTLVWHIYEIRHDARLPATKNNIAHGSILLYWPYNQPAVDRSTSRGESDRSGSGGERRERRICFEFWTTSSWQTNQRRLGVAEDRWSLAEDISSITLRECWSTEGLEVMDLTSHQPWLLQWERSNSESSRVRGALKHSPAPLKQWGWWSRAEQLLPESWHLDVKIVDEWQLLHAEQKWEQLGKRWTSWASSGQSIFSFSVARAIMSVSCVEASATVE